MLLSLIIYISILTLLGLVLLFISNVLGKRPSAKRVYDIYESGVNPVGSALSRYDVKFYLTAILFLLFDVEIALIFPWALSFRMFDDKLFLFFEFVSFMAVLIFGYFFILLSGSLNWED